MVEINLLPWREGARKKRERMVYIILIIGLIILSLMGVSLHYYFHVAIKSKQTNIGQYKQALLVMKLDFDKSNAIKQEYENLILILPILKREDEEKKKFISIMSEKMNQIPDPIAFTRFAYHNKQLELTGRALSVLDLSKLIKVLHAAQITELKAIPETTEISFQMRVNVHDS